MNCCLPIMEQLDFRRDLHERGGSFDELFHLDSKSYISWAAIRKQGKILCSQLKKNKELYLECLKEADLELSLIHIFITMEIKPWILTAWYKILPEQFQRKTGMIWKR